MSDEQEVVEEQVEEPELVIVEEEPEPEKKPEKPTVDSELARLRKENEDLKVRGDTGTAIKEGFSFLQEKLSAQGVPTTPPASEQDEESFWKGVEEGLFDKAPREALKKAVDRQARKLVREELGPLILSQMESAFENAEWRLRTDPKEGETYLVYEKEVQAELRKLPGVQQKDPRALREIYARVKASHVDEIIEAREKKRASVEREPVVSTPVRPRVLMESGGTHPATPEKKKVYLTRVEDEKRRRLGMTVVDYIAHVKEPRKSRVDR